MQKGKNLFTLILTTLLIMMGVSVISFYDNVDTKNLDKYNSIEYYFTDELQYTTLNLAMQLDSNYQPLVFSDSLSEEDKQYLQSTFNMKNKDIQSYIQKDKDFYYIAKNTSDGRILTNIKNYNPNTFNLDDYGFSRQITYDQNGNCTTDGKANYIYSSITGRNLFDNYNLASEVKVNNPKNIEIHLLFSKNIQSYEGMSGYLNSWEHNNTFTAIVFCLFSAIISVFILFYPIKYIEQANPFKIIKTWCFEFNLFTWTFVIFLAFMALLVITGNTINGRLVYIMNNYGITYGKMIVLFINLALWYFSLLAVSIGVFLIKFVITYGPIRYIKDYTLISKILTYLKNKLNIISDINLNSPMNLTIMKYVLIHGAITIFISIWDITLAFLLNIIYTFILFFYAKKRVQEIQDNYNTLLESIKNIISEDFDTITEKDFGIFESSKKELSQLSENFELAIQEKVKSEKMKTELISNVSHDLKTPLTCIKNYLTLLKNDELTLEDKHHYLDQLTLYTNRLKTLIEDLFEISKIDSGNINLNLQELDIVSLLNQAYYENEEMLESKNITCIKKMNTEKLLLNLDSDKTYRIFENLFTNINKYALPNSRAYLTLNELENHVEIVFSNISEVPMDFTSEQITERFVRGDKSRSKQGSGLGLAIARSFTQAQGGTFDIRIDCDLFKVIITFPKQ